MRLTAAFRSLFRGGLITIAFVAALRRVASPAETGSTDGFRAGDGVEIDGGQIAARVKALAEKFPLLAANGKSALLSLS